MHFSSSVRDLGFILDPVLSVSDHVNIVSRSCFYYLRQLRAIRQSLPLHAITTLVHALIYSRIDYGNAVYIGLSSTNTSKLQSILNAAARLMMSLLLATRFQWTKGLVCFHIVTCIQSSRLSMYVCM